MKHFFVAALIFGALIVASGLHESTAKADSRIQSGVMEFSEAVKLLDVTLKGEYLFLHHEGMMERGKPCTFVYRHDQGKPGAFVVSFHCRLVKREKTEQFKVIFSRKSACELPVIEEIQFAGSTEGHLVHN